MAGEDDDEPLPDLEGIEDPGRGPTEVEEWKPPDGLETPDDEDDGGFPSTLEPSGQEPGPVPEETEDVTGPKNEEDVQSSDGEP